MTDTITGEVAARLRTGLRRLAKAVVVITCRRDNTRFAMAATAVSELSMDPPSLLICVNRTASLHAPLSQGGEFCVNILHASHADIATTCGGGAKGEARFNIGSWAEGPSGTPYLQGAQASFFCRMETGLDYGTHSILIGQVTDVRTEGPVDPLVYVDGRYARVA